MNPAMGLNREVPKTYMQKEIIFYKLSITSIKQGISGKSFIFHHFFNHFWKKNLHLQSPLNFFLWNIFELDEWYNLLLLKVNEVSS